MIQHFLRATETNSYLNRKAWRESETGNPTWSNPRTHLRLLADAFDVKIWPTKAGCKDGAKRDGRLKQNQAYGFPTQENASLNAGVFLLKQHDENHSKPKDL